MEARVTAMETLTAQALVVQVDPMEVPAVGETTKIMTLRLEREPRQKVRISTALIGRRSVRCG